MRGRSFQVEWRNGLWMGQPQWWGCRSPEPWARASQLAPRHIVVTAASGVQLGGARPGAKFNISSPGHTSQPRAVGGASVMRTRSEGCTRLVRQPTPRPSGGSHPPPPNALLGDRGAESVGVDGCSRRRFTPGRTRGRYPSVVQQDPHARSTPQETRSCRPQGCRKGPIG